MGNPRGALLTMWLSVQTELLIIVVMWAIGTFFSPLEGRFSFAPNTRCESNYQSENLEPGRIPACTCYTAQKAEGAGNHQHLILFYPRGRPAGTWCSGSFMVCLSLCTFSVNKRREKSSVKQQYGPRYAKHIVNSWTIWQKWKRTCC